TLSKITALGILLAMDDFGTGYSSLSYLRSYPFRILKIDQSFIRDISLDKADRELISAAISMAHGLNLIVIAEGVETEEQLRYLRSQDCDYAQGYLFSKPISATDMTELLKLRSTSS
ncbi:MAG: EAL domain-containing protein, partial [Candidatus Thiodiazotropha sp.]